jgi:hypothetical protein
VGTQIADSLFGPHRLGDVLGHRDIAAAAHRIMSDPHRAVILPGNLFAPQPARGGLLAEEIEIDRYFSRSAALGGAIVENVLQSRAGNRQLSGQRVKLRVGGVAQDETFVGFEHAEAMGHVRQGGVEALVLLRQRFLRIDAR